MTSPTTHHDPAALLAELARLRTRYANLLAAARATLAAHHDGEPDPLYYLRDELENTR